MPYNAEDLTRLMRIILTRGMDISPDGFSFKHHSKDPAARKAPFKFNLCTNKVRSEGRLTREDVAFMTKLLWNDIVTHDLWGLRRWGSKAPLPCVAGIPNVGDEISDGVCAHAKQDGIIIPRIWLSKVGTGEQRHIGPVVREDEAARGLPVCLFDDLVTRGTSKEEVVEPLLAAAHKPTYTVVILDYKLGGSALLNNELGMELQSVLSVEALFSFARCRIAQGEALLASEMLESCVAYLKDEQASLRQ